MSDRGSGVSRALRRTGRPLVRRVRRARRRRELRDALDTLRRGRGLRFAFTYHRIAPRETPRYEVVPTIPLDLFREQLHAFGELGRVVPLRALLEDPHGPGEPLQFALTFDDDYTTHARHALPVLRELDLPAVFFLSGRALHGLGGYWFQRLEALLVERGLAGTAALLDLQGVPEAQLALRCEGDTRRLALIEEHAPPADGLLDGSDMRALNRAGMTIGFHTLHHPVLPTLGDDLLREALTAGRQPLAEHVGQPLEWFAYPHGKADARTVALTREAGYTAAWTTEPRSVRAGDDPYRLGRWEPQPLATDAVLIRFAQFLQRVNG